MDLKSRRFREDDYKVRRAKKTKRFYFLWTLTKIIRASKSELKVRISKWININL